ncbi:hypothetical protein HDU77_008894 [Chytriomyces hyalinus]|nr:hypothetical protein HDU77_008894 [Chytriomyces hyalinus]
MSASIPVQSHETLVQASLDAGYDNECAVASQHEILHGANVTAFMSLSKDGIMGLERSSVSDSQSINFIFLQLL